MTRWERDNEIESEWTKRLNNAVTRAYASTSVEGSAYDIRTTTQITDTNSTVDDARRLLTEWTTNSYGDQADGYIFEDLNLAALETITNVDPAHVASAGDFVHQYLDTNIDLSADSAIHNTEQFVQQLMKVDIPKSAGKAKNTNIRQNQTARQQLINERRAKREKESKIRFAAERAAREAQSIRYADDKGMERKRREKEDKLLSAEIARLKSQLQKEQNQSKVARKVENTKVIQQAHRDAADRRKLQEERRRQMDLKIKLEAKNKIIIHERIEKHRKKNLYLQKRYFIMWSSILVERRKQAGVAAACYDWRITKSCFTGWRRYARRQRDYKMIEHEKQRAKTIQMFRHKAVRQKDQMTICKVFQAWRIHAKRECEKRKLLDKEAETQRKMEDLLTKIKRSKLSMKPVLIEDISEQTEVSRVVPVTPRTPRSRHHKPPPNPPKSAHQIHPIQAWQINGHNAQAMFEELEKQESHPLPKQEGFDPYENRHRHQMHKINEQTKRLQLQTETIAAFAAEKVS